MAVCNCNDGVLGFGTATCVGLASRAVGFGFRKNKSYGSYNAIDGSSDTTQAAWETFLFTSDADVRMNVLRNVKTVVDERADPDFEELDGVSYVVAEGQRYISFEVIGTPSKLKTIVEGLRCGEYGFTMITADNQLAGWKVAEDLRGIPVEKGTLYTKIIPATRTTKTKLMVKFMVAESFDDGDMGYIPADMISADLLGTNPQVEAIVEAGIATATTATVTVDYYANDSTTPQDYVGADVGDFTLYNVTTDLAVTVTVTEPTDGNYVLTFVAQTAADVLELRDKNASPITFTTVDGLIAV